MEDADRLCSIGAEQELAIEALQKHGIQLSDISKLRAAGICTLKGGAMASKRTLYKIKGLSEIKVDKIKECLAKEVDCDFCSAADFAAKRLQIKRLSTGSSDFDVLLGGGVQTMAITEVFGEFRTGKTQLALTLCVTTQLPEEQGGAGGKAAFVDTEGTFRPERLREIAGRFGLDADAVLSNVLVARAYNAEHQNELLDRLALRFAEEPGAYRLLVIDSVISLFRTDYSGRGELGERQQRLNQHLARLLRMADEFNLAVLISNQMMADPGATVTFVADPKKPIGGHVLAHASTTRVYLKKGRCETRIAKIYDSPDVPESEATYAITEGGIANAVE
ncbi:meiotic recombination protein DMC1 [Pancytospora philotis]|nr:meiotic recombination protein DMC1 [Pancytospora philotis]